MIDHNALRRHLAPLRAGGLVVVLAAVLLVPRPLQAWGDSGHRIVAQIGQDHLSPAARAAIAELAGRQGLAMLATWPDFIRSEKPWDFAKPWHFLTVEEDETIERVLERSARKPGPDNVVEAIRYFRAVLEGDAEATRHFEQMLAEQKVEPQQGLLRLTALTFFVHFIGDVHQPLHVGRGNDRGGNSVSVNWFGEIQKLHSVWDSGLIDSENLSFTEFVAFLEAELGGEVEAGSGDPVAWAQESIDYRHRIYEIWDRTSRDNYLPDLSYVYSHDHIGTVKRRLYQGGLRLAEQLNAIFD